ISSRHLGPFGSRQAHRGRRPALEDIMSTDVAAPVAEETSLPLAAVETEIARLAKELQDGDSGPVLHARMSNLVVFSLNQEQAQAASSGLPDILAMHPARVILTIGESLDGTSNITAAAIVRGGKGSEVRQCFTEQITLNASGRALEKIPYAVRELLIGDLP